MSDNQQDRWWENQQNNSQVNNYPQGYPQEPIQQINYEQSQQDSWMPNNYTSQQNNWEQIPQNNSYSMEHQQDYQQQTITPAPEKLQKQKKVKKHRKKKKLKLGDILILLLVAAVIFFVIQYFTTESILNNVLPDEPFKYTAETDYRDYVTSNIVLPDVLTNEKTSYDVVWESSHPDIIGEDGTVNRPVDESQVVTLTVKLKQGFWHNSREFELTVIKSGTLQPEDVFILTDEMIENQLSKNEFLITYNEDNSIHSIDGNFGNTLVESEADALVVIDVYRDLLKIPTDISFVLDNIQTSLLGKNYYFNPTKNDIKIAGQGIVISTNNNYLNSITTSIKDVSCDLSIDLTATELLDIVKTDTSLTDAEILEFEKIISDNKLIYTLIVSKPDGNLLSITVDAESKTITSKEEIVFDCYDTTGTGVDEQGMKQTFPVVAEKTVLATKYQLIDSKRNIVIVDGSDYTWAKLKNTEKFKAITNNKNEWGDYPVGISAMVNFANIYDWYKDVLGYTSFDGKGQTIYCFINAHEIRQDMYDNAAYVPYGIEVFLGGEEKQYLRYAPIAKLEVAAHEFTHGVFGHIAKHAENSSLMMTSIDEGYADIFGCLIEGDWVVGEGIVIGYEAKRDPSNTVQNLSKKFPQKYLDENWDYDDGHINSVLISRAAYQMLQQGFSENDVARIWFQSMYYGYYDGDDFLTVRSHVEKAARALGYSEEQIIIIGDIFANLGIGKMATREIESFAVDGDRLKDNSTEKTYLIVYSPIATVLAEAPIFIFEENTNVSSTMTDEQMSAFLSSYFSSRINSSVEEITLNINVDYRKYSPWALDIINKYVTDAKQGFMDQITTEGELDKEMVNGLMNFAFCTFKYHGTAYEFFNEILEVDYSRLTTDENGNVNYDMTPDYE